jgi:DNA-binding MarR family transcriptional regulator
MKTKQAAPPSEAQHLYVNLQRIFRSLSFGRGLRGRIPTLTGTQMRLLTFFNEKEVVHISEISRVLGMSMQSVNNLVARLETLGYVERSKNKSDKRLSDVQLTAMGREGFNAFRNEQFKTLTGILNQLEPAERNILSATIENAALILEKAALKATQTEPDA